MVGHLPLVLLAVPSQSMMGNLVDFSVLAAAIVLAIISGLALVRQLLFALWPSQ